MTCKICGNHNMVYIETVTFSNGKKYDVYGCRECGFRRRVEK